jgi:hypothetical protein
MPKIIEKLSKVFLLKVVVNQETFTFEWDDDAVVEDAVPMFSGIREQVSCRKVSLGSPCPFGWVYLEVSDLADKPYRPRFFNRPSGIELKESSLKAVFDHYSDPSELAIAYEELPNLYFF